MITLALPWLALLAITYAALRYALRPKAGSRTYTKQQLKYLAVHMRAADWRS